MTLIIPSPPADDASRLRDACAARYGRSPDEVTLVHAPYRVCPLGAHIDHQLGPVSAFATAHGVTIAWVVNDEPEVVINSLGYEGEIHFNADVPQSRAGDWADYARGAANVLNSVRPLVRGVSLLIEGRLSEAGLSSSAAVGLGYLQILATANGFEPGPRDLVEFDRRIENEFMQLNNGILDPAAIAYAQPENLTIIHCRDRSTESVAAGADFRVVAVYSGLREALVSSGKFNDRVGECLAAGGELQKLAGSRDCRPQPLGNTDPATWERLAPRLDDMHRRRARHFFSESARVLEGATAWGNGAAGEFGRLMHESCLSSINNYETGSPEMIRLFELMSETSGVLGARFCGAGFRGCCIALVEPGTEAAVIESVIDGYLREYPRYEDDVWAIHARPSAGLRVL